MAKRYNKKILSWALYDFGNSAFSTTVMAGFFPIFFKSYWSDGASAIDTTARLGSSISLASFIIAFLTPFLGAMVDLKESKKKFLFFFVLIGVFATAWLSWVGRGEWIVAATAYGVAMMSFSAGSVFYDSLLPSLGKGTQLDYASSLGFSLGYLGGGLLFFVNVLMYLKPHLFGIATPVQAVQLSFLSVAIWWLGFTFPLLLNVPEPKGVSPSANVSLVRLVINSLVQLKTTFAKLIINKNLFIHATAPSKFDDYHYT
jgi:UMF1 family MFS transporter